MAKATKKANTKMYPMKATDVSGLVDRVEPFLTVQKFKNRFLLGIPKTLPNGDEITDDIIKDRIVLAANQVELLTGITVEPVEFTDRVMFDRDLYKHFVHIKTTRRPVLEVSDLGIYSANGECLFRIPLEWVEVQGNGQIGQINVVPFLAATNGVTATGIVSNAGIAFLATLDNVHTIPAYWNITYTSGLCNKAGDIPLVVNELIGVIAAIDLLSLIGPSNPHSSISLSQDGIGQSSSGPGFALFAQRLNELQQKKEELIRKIKGIYNRKMWVGNI